MSQNQSCIPCAIDMITLLARAAKDLEPVTNGKQAQTGILTVIQELTEQVNAKLKPEAVCGQAPENGAGQVGESSPTEDDHLQALANFIGSMIEAGQLPSGIKVVLAR